VALSDLPLLATVAAVEFVVVVLLVLVYLGHAARLGSMERIVVRRREIGRSLFAKGTRDALDAAEIAELRALPMSDRIAAFVAVASSIDGQERDRLSAIANVIGLVAWSEREVTHRHWHRRLYAARVLTLTTAVSPALPSLLRDRDPFVRVQAAEWAAAPGSAQNARDLSPLLHDAVPAVRFAARDALRRIGSAAIPVLLDIASGDGADVIPALEVLALLANPRAFGPALRHSEDARPRVRAAALTVLGALGLPEGEERLVAALSDMDARVRRAAATAIGRLAAWPRALSLAPLLDDADWDVRMAAAGALRALGAPGLIALRELARGPTLAADVARHALDVAALEPAS
jgi:hypothetical protein